MVTPQNGTPRYWNGWRIPSTRLRITMTDDETIALLRLYGTVEIIGESNIKFKGKGNGCLNGYPGTVLYNIRRWLDDSVRTVEKMK